MQSVNNYTHTNNHPDNHTDATQRLTVVTNRVSYPLVQNVALSYALIRPDVRITVQRVTDSQARQAMAMNTADLGFTGASFNAVEQMSMPDTVTLPALAGGIVSV